ncbi:MAG: ABC transporter ATP-binding protein [Saprospiraceae bacterium]
MITINDLYKSYGKNQVLKGLNLSFREAGKITAILGPNGSGKTTLIKCLLGMVIPDQGAIMIQDKSIRGEWAYRENIDYLPQIARFPENLSVRELIAFIKDIRGGHANEGVLIDLFGLKDQLDERLANLSGGTKQKVNLTLTFMNDSPLVILDEPTSGLDPVAMQHLRELIHQEKQKGKMILITTHIMSFVEEMADEIVFLLEGKIYFRGTLNALKAQYNETNVERAIAQILSGKAYSSTNGQQQKEQVAELKIK